MMTELFREHWEKVTAACAVGGAVLGAIVLAVLVHFYPVPGIDVRITREVQEGGRALLPFMQFISIFGVPTVSLLLTACVSLLFLFFSYRREAAFALATVMADAANIVIKFAVRRPRPTDTFVTVYQKFADPSFPSGHVVHYVVFFGFIAVVMLVHKKIPQWVRIPVVAASLALILSVSVSRIYLGAHWATDVIGGYCVGLGMLAALLSFYFKGFKNPD